MDIKLLKQRAREVLNKNRLTVALVAFIGMLIGGFEGLLSILIGAPILAGISWFYLDLYDGKPTELKAIFKPFRLYLKIVGAFVVMGIFISLWTLLLIVPGLIKTVSYSQTFYLLKEDPDLGILEAITKSRELMDGQKIKYVLTILSFWPWVVAPVIIGIVVAMTTRTSIGVNEIMYQILKAGSSLSFGITNPISYDLPTFLNDSAIMGLLSGIYGLIFFFFVTPYYYTTLAGFYRELRQKGNATLEY